MKVKYSQIFRVLKAKGIYPLTGTEASYGEAVREVVLDEIGNPGASHDSVLFHRVTELSLKFAKNARHHWKKGHKSHRAAFFQGGEMEVITDFFSIFQIFFGFQTTQRRIVVQRTFS